MSGPEARFLEDLRVGEKFETSLAHTVTEAEIVEFASRYDPQPMHTDPVAARQGPFEGLIASGWHTAAMTMRLWTDAKPLGSTPLIGMNVDHIRWPKPVRPGDTLRVQGEVVAITPSKSHPDHGVVKIRMTVTNQRGEVVMLLEPNTWVPRRPATINSNS